MSYDIPPLTVGVEEEYLLVDINTRDLAQDPPKELIDKCRSRTTGK